METSVSLLVMTRLALAPDGPKQLLAVLQRRGEFNHETLGKESWAGACQLTVHGQINPGETGETTLFREVQEELGQVFASAEFPVERNLDDLVVIGGVKKTDKTIVHYAMEILPARLADIRLNASSGGLRLISKSDLPDVQGLPNCYANKTEGVSARRAIAMFPDEIEALKRAFAIFGQLPGAQPDEDEAPLRHHVHAWADSQLTPPS